MPGDRPQHPHTVPAARAATGIESSRLLRALLGDVSPRLYRKLFWVLVLYFAEGFPFGIVYDLLPVYFRTHGVSLREIGLLSLIGLPWSLKVLWSPLVDSFGQRRHWITGALIAMAIILALLPFFPPAEPSRLLWALLLAFTVCSATQDIAIDAFTIELMDRGEEGAANSLRTGAYRAAMIVGGGGLVLLATWLPWAWMLRVGSAIFLGLALLAWRSPEPLRTRPEAVVGQGPLQRLLSSRAFVAILVGAVLVALLALLVAPFRIWLRGPVAIPVLSFAALVLLVLLHPPLQRWRSKWSALAVFAFVLLYKLGDSSMGPMVKPFWVDRGLTPAEIGTISTGFGIWLSVVGAVVGGWVTLRVGIFHSLWILGIFQALSNLGYAAAAHFVAPRAGIYAASVFESFTGGLGTAAFLSFLMNLCDKQSAAVQYALLSALFGYTRSVAGAASGWATEQLGYASYFALTFALSFPAYLLLPWVRGWIREQGRAGGENP